MDAGTEGGSSAKQPRRRAAGGAELRGASLALCRSLWERVERLKAEDDACMKRERERKERKKSENGKGEERERLR